MSFVPGLATVSTLVNIREIEPETNFCCGTTEPKTSNCNRAQSD